MKKIIIILLSPFLWAMNLSAQSSGAANGHQYVDLGLPSGLLWATCNVGADSLSDCGDYFAWGETTPKNSYTSENCLTSGKILSDISGDARYDVARANWGGDWRIPTKAEFQELRNHCVWTWTKQNNIYGYKISSIKNDNSIFIPIGNNSNKHGNYWLSTSMNNNESSSAFSFNIDHISCGILNRHHGLLIRPVINVGSYESLPLSIDDTSGALTGVHEGHEWVDLGLSVKWATCDVKNSKWGKIRCQWGTIISGSSDTYNTTTKDISGDPRYDLARASWGGGWRIPTVYEVMELIDKCVWEEIDNDQYKVTSRKNGKSIIIDKRDVGGNMAKYWTSTPCDIHTLSAYILDWDGMVSSCPRKYVLNIRPVLGN